MDKGKGVSSNTHTKQQVNHYANQHNPNNSANKANNNNHANQCNPNNLTAVCTFFYHFLAVFATKSLHFATLLRSCSHLNLSALWSKNLVGL